MRANVLVTGAAGYIGSMVVEALSQSSAVERIIAVDIRAQDEPASGCGKVRFVQADISEDLWIEAVANEAVDVVIHCAYQIRQLYGSKAELQRRWNIDGARKVFGFAFGRPSVRRIIQLSTISAYGSQADNSLDVSFDENTPLREDVYLYGTQKKEVETLLQQLYRQHRPATHVVVLRLASVSGPHGRFDLNRYGLVSTVAGRFPYLLCGRADWGRQYLHEDDVVAVIAMMAELPAAPGFDVFNVSPKDHLSAYDLGRLFRKRVLLAPPSVLRVLFWLIWHGTRGALTTPPGAWKFLSYPIRVDGSRLKEVYGYECRYSSLQALVADVGQYAEPRSAALEDQSKASREPRRAV